MGNTTVAVCKRVPCTGYKYALGCNMLPKMPKLYMQHAELLT